MRGRTIEQRDFSGGLNLSAGPSGLAENETGFSQNFRSTVRGSLKSRLGDVNVLDATDLGAQIMMSLSAVESLGAGQADTLLAGMADGKLYHYVSGSTATLLGTFTAGATWDFIDAPASGGQGPVYGVNGTIAKQITTVPAVADWTASAGTLPATAKYLAYVGNRVWAAGMSSYGALTDPRSALAFSELGDPRNWPAANVVQFDPNDGEDITGVGAVGAGLLVFKRSKAWLVYDLDTGANRPLGVGVGCISHRSITQTPYGTVWSGDKQIWTTDGTTVRPLGEKMVSASIFPGFESTLLPGNDISIVYLDNRLLVGPYSSVGGTAGLLYEYDFTTKAWWQHTARGGLLALAQIDPATSPSLYAGGSGLLDRLLYGGYLAADGSALIRGWAGPYLTLGSGKDRLRGVAVEGYGLFGVAAVPDFGATLTQLTTREVRAEETTGSPAALPPIAAVRRESDFKTFNGVQVYLFAQGLSYSGSPLVTAPIVGYTPTDVQIDAYTLYVTRRPG